MKQIIVITVIVFMTLAALNAQWTEVNSNTDSDITDIHFIDSEYGFISCAFGTVLRTVSGGLDWQAYNTEIPVSFMSIFGIDKDTVYASRGALYKSTDSCVSWKSVGGLGSWGATIFDIYFTSPQTGFIIKSGKLYKTNDYGANWYQVYDRVFSNGNIIFPAHDTGYVVGGGQAMCDPLPCNPPINYGTIIKTTDGGETWNRLYFFNGTLNIIGASFIDKDFGYCFSSNNTVQKTEDGGLTWTSINTGITGTVYKGLFVNKYIGFCIANHDEVYITTNGGISWIREYTARDNLSEIGNSDKIVAVGGNQGLICIRSLDNIKTYEDSKDILVYPNPANSYVVIQLKKETAVQYVLSLRNLQGQVVLSEIVMVNDIYRLDLNNISSGIYFLTLSNGTERIVKKIIVTRISEVSH